MKVLRWLAIGIGLLVLFLVLLGVAARFSDGPIAIFPGGPLQSGEWVENPAVEVQDEAIQQGLIEIVGDKYGGGPGGDGGAVWFFRLAPPA